MRLEVQGLAGRLACVHLRDELADAIDQHVLVMDRGQTLDRRRDLNMRGLVLIGQHAPVGPGAKREDRMLHRGHVILGDGVEHVTDEEIRRRVAVGQERGAHRAGVFCGHGQASPTQQNLTWFHLR